MAHLTQKQTSFIEHFPCDTCGSDPYQLVRTLKLDAYSDTVDICKEGLRLLSSMLEEQGIETHFEPQN